MSALTCQFCGLTWVFPEGTRQGPAEHAAHESRCASDLAVLATDDRKTT